MEEKFHKVILARIEPVQYAKYLEMQPRKPTLFQGDFLTDNRYNWSEILYEQINTGFWVFSLETEETIDTCYVYTPKNSKKEYFSINYYEARNPFGYQLGEKITFDNNVTIFSGPSATFKIYLRKKSRIKCYRLVFSGRYLKKLLNFAAANSIHYETSHIVLTGKGSMIRPTYEIEKWLLKNYIICLNMPDPVSIIIFHLQPVHSMLQIIFSKTHRSCLNQFTTYEAMRS